MISNGTAGRRRGWGGIGMGMSTWCVMAGVVLAALRCARNPADIDYSADPVADRTYCEKGLRVMVADTDGAYWACSRYSVYHIDPSRPDSTGNIVQPVFDPYLWDSSTLYRDPVGRPTLIVSGSIYRPVSSDSLGVVADMPFCSDRRWLEHVSVDNRGVCRFPAVSGERLVVYSWDGEEIDSLFSDSLDRSRQCDRTHFAASESLAVLVCTTPDTARVRLYLRGELTVDRPVLHCVEGVDIRAVYVHAGKAVVVVWAENEHWYPCDDGYDDDRPGWCRITERYCSPVGIHPDPDSAILVSGIDSAEMEYYAYGVWRSETELWVSSWSGYMAVTPDGISWHPFRRWGPNDYNVFCIVDDGALFYNEYTRDFALMK